MNKMIWRTAIVGGVMAAGLFTVPGSLTISMQSRTPRFHGMSQHRFR